MCKAQHPLKGTLEYCISCLCLCDLRGLGFWNQLQGDTRRVVGKVTS